MARHPLFILIILLAGPFKGVRGQADTLVALPAVEIREVAIRTQEVGGYTRSWSVSELQSHPPTNLGEWLSREGGLFIKSYGGGSIATTSIRGGSAAHTTVLWNGLPVQSPMLGQLDFSLFPLAFFDAAQLHYGGNSAAWGSGAIGGVVDLRNQLPADSTSRLSLQTSLGSFGLRNHQLTAGHDHGKWGFRTRLFHRRANNDFKFRLRPDLPQQQQANAALRQTALLQTFFWRPNPRQELALHLWPQTAEREVPPTTTQTQSLARQSDAFLRTALHWKLIRPRTVWRVRLGLFRETIDFRDELIALRAQTGFRILLADLEGSSAWGAHQQLQYGLSYTGTTAEADAYATPPHQSRLAPFVAYRRQLGDWRLQLNLRQEMVDGELLPPMPGLGVEGALTPWLQAHARLSRNYRLPTLNDLYWRPGGNADLLPENGWSQEGGLQLRGGKGPTRWSYRITAFNRNISNWILWSRPEGQAFWSSNNITRVWSRGLEQRINWEVDRPNWSCRLSAGYDYIRSTNERDLAFPRLAAGEQLIYTPVHQAFVQLSFHWREWRLHYRHTLTGEVQTPNDGPLPAYQLGFLNGAWRLPFTRGHLQLFWSVNNLWDRPYRVLERRPMPGRHFQVGLQFQVHKKPSTS